MSDVEASVLAVVRNHIGHLTLNRPLSLNALTLDMVRHLQRHLKAWEHNPEVVAVVLRASGDRAFAPAATSACFTTVTNPAATNMRRSLKRSMPSTNTYTPTPSPSWS